MSTTIQRLVNSSITSAHQGDFSSVSVWNSVVDLVRLSGEVHIAIAFGRIQGIPEKFKTRRQHMISEYVNSLRKIQDK
jgi:hypothetical protein